MTEDVPKAVMTPGAKTCGGRCCPLQTPTGLATYIIALAIGILAPWPWQFVGLALLLALFAKAIL